MKWIKKFDEKMADDVMEIWLSTNQEAHDFIPDKYWEKTYNSMRKALSEELDVYVYNADGVVKGFVVMTDDAHIAGLYVDRAYRREGIGSKLLEKCKEEHDKLTLDVYLKNQKALEFYKRHGFKHFKHRVDSGTIEREFVMKWVNKN